MKVKKLVFLSVLLSLAIILNYIETFIPSIGIPGVKIGLANIIILLTIYNFKGYEAFLITILRILIVSFILGTFLNVTFFMSLSGGLLSFIAMLLLKKIKLFSIVGVSIAGSFSHAVGQIAVAMLYMGTSAILYYVPLIILLSIPTGILVGLVSSRLNKLKLFTLTDTIE